MIIKIPYGVKPGEKIVEEGFWACPVCLYKRPFLKKKVVKVNYVGFIKISSKKTIMEYIHCGGCLNVFPPETAKPENQLKIKILQQPLPPDSLFQEWEKVFQDLECGQILSNSPDLEIRISPLLATSAEFLEKAGVSIKSRMFDEAKKHLYNVLALYNQWMQHNTQLKGDLSRKMPANAARHKQFSDVAHYLLSKLP